MPDRKWRILPISLGPNSLLFIRRTGLTTGAFLFSKVFTVAATILLGRWIGEEGIGQSWGIVAGGMTIATILSLGLPATLNVYIPKGQSNGRAEWSFGLFVSLMAVVGFALAYPFVEPALGLGLELAHTDLLLAVGIGIASNTYNLCTAALQGLHLARARVYCELLMSFSTGALSLAIACWGEHAHLAMPLGMMAGMLVGLVPALPHLIPRSSLESLWASPIKIMAGYSLFSLLCGLGALFGSSIQRIQIKRLLSESDLGLYGMSSQASIGLAYTVAAAIGSVLIAKTAARLDKPQVIKTILRVWLLLSPMIVLTLYVGQWAAFRLANFPFSHWLAFYLSIASLLIMIHTSLGNVMSGQGIWGGIVGVVFSAIHAGTIWGLTEWLVPLYGVSGGAMALIGGYVTIIAIAIGSLPWFFKLPDHSSPGSSSGSETH